jgi:ketosteroid isomerase-like protein
MKTSLMTLLLIAALPCARADDHDKQCADLARAERNFCDQAAKLGIDEAFLANLADECFIPDSVALSRAEYEAQVKAARAKAGDASKGGPDPNVQLVWSPSKVDVSADGTLGYTWGRYDYSERGNEGKVSTSTGLYLTIWKRQAGGAWKVVYDGGPELPGGPAALKKFLARPDFPKPPAG